MVLNDPCFISALFILHQVMEPLLEDSKIRTINIGGKTSGKKKKKKKKTS